MKVVRTALRELPQDAHNAPDEVLFRLAEERGSIRNGSFHCKKIGLGNLSVRVGFG